MDIRPFKETDWANVWPIIETVFREGETYPYSPDISEEDAYKAWVELPRETFVAVNLKNELVGTYYIKPNQPSLGAHVCNCGYIVSENHRGQGIASTMCAHSQQAALGLGFKAMQFNLVVTTNKKAIHVWEKSGLQVIGTLPKAFNSRRSGYVDALVMFKEL